ncbi:MAG: ABC transporter permease [Spirochaetaceae bacterium]|jgi:peptide/nickel transport system permease protein|nr:ABC transporter permease [Spirochaetaceae bacterium]
MKYNRRTKTIILTGVMVLLIATVAIAGLVMDPARYGPNYAAKRLPPSWSHLFGTDYLGRDMFSRTVKGLSTSILIGTLAATVSAGIALSLGLAAATIGGLADKIVGYVVDLMMGIPHMVLLIIIAFLLGRGLQGVILGVALTHWPNLTRVIRAEVLQVREAPFVQSARQLGKSPLKIALDHILPHVLPQGIIGLILLFPHAILHEAGITFLGFGLSVDTPAIGIILSESMKHIALGMWWLVFFPGGMLVTLVMLFDKLGEQVKLLLDPVRAQE